MVQTVDEQESPVRPGSPAQRAATHRSNYYRRAAMLREAGHARRDRIYRSLERLPARAPTLLESREYWRDFVRRSVLLLDVLRQRGNQFIEYEASGQPPLLAFDYEVLIDGRDLPDPVNYCLLRIAPPEGVTVDETKRPYLIIDPRAGHGAGIGGFKEDSQVGVALQEGNPVYFTVFYPEPEPGQTLGRVAAAQLHFVREIARRHPNSPKPALVGNCQGGWAAMSLAAVDPEITGPLVLNGAPLSYWAGVHGKNPMRYLAGLTGGGWPAYLTADLGNGRFDGAWLVQNFESMNPANTLWAKYYRVFKNIDTEVPRFLDFEKWWGGFVQMSGAEIRGIVDDLFVGNKLATGGLPIGPGRMLDLRRVRSPIVVFCSHGDDITPPQQALNWIADTYPSTREIKAHGQTIVYIVHDKVGHLGIFVSGSVVQREFSQIAGTLATIETLPPGLYELVIEDAHLDERGLQHYDVSLHEREIDDILEHDDTREDEENFRLVAGVSQLNGGFYDLFVSPWIRAISNDATAHLMRETHPMRTQRYFWSDLNPFLWWLRPAAASVSKQTSHVRPDNPLLAVQETASDLIQETLGAVRDQRDASYENAFHAIYGALSMSGTSERFAAGRLLPNWRGEELSSVTLESMSEGGLREGIVRMLLLLMKAGGSVRRETLVHVQKQLRSAKAFKGVDADVMRNLVSVQNAIVAYEPEQALETLVELLPSQRVRSEAMETLRHILPKDIARREALRAELARFEEVLGESWEKKA